MNREFNETRTGLANEFATAGATLLDYMGTAAALAAIPSTEPPRYVVAGTLAEIVKLLPAAGAIAESAAAQPVAASAGIEGLTTYDPDRDTPGLMESRTQFNDGDWCKVEDVRELLATQSAKQGAQQAEANYKLIQRTIIGLRDGWGRRADADTALAALCAGYAAPAAPLQTMDDTTRDEALEEAAERLDSMNDSSGDAAAYDQREQDMYELEREHAISACAKAIRAMKSRPASTDQKGNDHA